MSVLGVGTPLEAGANVSESVCANYVGEQTPRRGHCLDERELYGQRAQTGFFKTVRFVMLNAVKHLIFRITRPFASLRVTLEKT